MNRILHLLQTHDGYGDVGGIRPIADVFADEDAIDLVYASFWDSEESVKHGFFPTPWEAALLIETELEQHYGRNAVERFFTDWSERELVNSNTLQPTDEDRAADAIRELDQYAEHHDRCYTD